MAVKVLLRIGILPGFVVLLGGIFARAIERDIAAAGDRIVDRTLFADQRGAEQPGRAGDLRRWRRQQLRRR